MKRRPRNFVASHILTAALIASGAFPAFAVECGDLITHDTILDQDLNCPEDGLVIGANGVTLDLGGHVIASSDPGNGAVGIRNEGFDRARIQDGTLFGYEVAVLLERGRLNRVVGLEIVDGGVRLEGSDHNRLSENSFTAFDVPPIHLIDSHHNRIERNRGFWEGGSVELDDSHGNMLKGNAFDADLANVITLVSSHGNRIVANRFDHGDDGISLSGSHSNLIARNAFAGSFLSDVYLTDSHRNEISDNSARGSLDGIFISGNHNLVRRNRAATGNAIRVGGGVANRLEGNVARSEFEDGIFVSDQCRDTVLMRNIASDNPDDGIDVEDPTATLSHNLARGNGDYGIEAVPGVRGRGHNVAFENGNPDQCINVECASP